MRADRLLAKSLPADRASTPQSVYLANHLQDVHAAATKLLQCSADNQLSALGLDPGLWKDRFRDAVLLSAAVHDLGKANDHFQGMLDGDRFPERRGLVQGLRHEWVGVLMVTRAGLGEWLAPAAKDDDLVWYAAIWAVSGHHPAYGRESPPRSAVAGGGSELRLLMGHHEFCRCLAWLAETCGLSPPPNFQDQVLPLIGSHSAFKLLFDAHREAMRFWKRLGYEERRFVAAVKGCLIAADVAGSALPKELESARERSRWIGACFGRIPKPEEIQQIIIDRLMDAQGHVGKLRPFQREVADKASEVTFVKAGCGTGKTLAAYHWARFCCPGRRLYFCYPTTGTATEGFRDYLVSGEAPKFDSRLFHSRASVDLEMLGVQTSDNESDDVIRIESLDAWSTPIVNCTVDTVLGLVQNNRRGLYAWPALAGAAFIFDEIHAYDDRLFGALLRFLSALPGVPLLLMTASLPEYRRRALRNMLGARLAEVAGPEDLEVLPRYHQQGCLDSGDALDRVGVELDRGGKVLWVCNTVDRAINAAERAALYQPAIYHSRFRYEDRVEQHRRVISQFKNPGSSLAICTQVAEMSLDLSATLLVTDLAPVPALIQRLGRLNRRARPQAENEPSPPTMPFIILEPQNADGSAAVLPYRREDLELAQRWLERLPTEDVSQRDLATAWEDIHVQTVQVDFVSSAWLDGGPVTNVLELREASPGITVIMASDLTVLTHPDPSQRKLVAEVAVPMPPPKNSAWIDWKRFRGLPVAPQGTIDYAVHRGARWIEAA